MTHTTTLRIHSNPLIYSVGMFSWIEEAIMPFDDYQARRLLDGIGIRADLIDPIMNGQYTTQTEGETLILTITHEGEPQ